LYGLPKIHKDGCPLRPIISAVGTYNYKLAKFLVEILSPLLEKDEHTIKDTFDFVNKISSLDLDPEDQMVSFDVVSLFTNVPTDETIEDILDLAYNSEHVKDGAFHGLQRQSLKYLLTVCTKESHFQFNGKFYDQIDGVAMGCSLGPLFANVAMRKFEKKHMPKLIELGIKHWSRYVDGIFAQVKNKECQK
jgi:hypothetical protein